MLRKLIALAVALASMLSMTALTQAYGFDYGGGLTDETLSFGFSEDEAVVVGNGILNTDPNYSELLPGTVIYVPIVVMDERDQNPQLVRATSKHLKDNELRASIQGVVGGNFVESVDTVDGKKEKIKGMEAGVYAKIKLVDDYLRLNPSAVELKLVLSVNKVSYQQTRVEFRTQIANRTVEIDDNSVYGAETPTKFKTNGHYYGDVSFDFGKGITYAGRVTRTGVYYLNLSREKDPSLSVMYPKFYMEYYNFLGGNDSFPSNGSLKIDVNNKKFTNKAGQVRVYTYEIVGDTLYALDSTKAGFDKGSGATGTVTIRTNTLGNYVLSAEKLNKAIEPDSDYYKNGYADPPIEISKPAES
ncbi:hypothetical protein U6B65_10205 [Oscillospiraceae bacterium MB08-C2-2]|nr:hypothetical protein U6B65_10205 [Oscillospiraceae bacterium MB08-C2-2]